MPKYKNGRDAKEGDQVVGTDKDGKPIKGMLVMIHRHAGKGQTGDLPDIAVSQNQQLIGDLHAANFLPVADDKSATPAPVENPPGN